MFPPSAAHFGQILRIIAGELRVAASQLFPGKMQEPSPIRSNYQTFA